jgi:glycosyltransferase involved in cell wall biosynthesis
MSGPRDERNAVARPAVLIVAPQPFYEDRGTPIATRQVATSLAMLGYDVDLLVYPVGAEQSIEGVRIIRSPNLFGVRSVPVGFSLRKLVLDLGMIGSFWRLTRSRRYAAVHAVEEMAFVAAAMRRSHCAVVYDMQSSLPDQLRSHAMFRPGVVQRLLRSVESWLIRRVDAIVCSAGLKEYVASQHPNADITELMYLSAMAQPDPALAAALRARHGIPAIQRIVLYAGTFEPYQGLDDLIDAMPAVLEVHPDTVFVLVGATPDSSLADDERARAMVEARRLWILPRQDRSRIPSFLAMADVLVSSRAYGDNVPLKIFDYLAAGKPIVATDLKAHRALLDEDCAILVGNSGTALAAGINRLLRDDGLARSLAERALLRSGRGAGSEPFDRLVESVYARVCSRRVGVVHTSPVLRAGHPPGPPSQSRRGVPSDPRDAA